MWLLALTLADTPPRTVWFADRAWEVKSGHHGPGPNDFSDSNESVWVDESGALHLRLTWIDGAWRSAEVRSVGCTRYGKHGFTLAPRSQPDPQVVLGLFLYADDSHEADIELSQWGDPMGPSLWWTAQPMEPGSQRTLMASQDAHTLGLTWRRQALRFSTTAPPTTWTYRGPRVPARRDDLHIHLNLWLFEGHAPDEMIDHEVVIESAQLPRARPC
jgi:hypothetical protein